MDYQLFRQSVVMHICIMVMFQIFFVDLQEDK